MKAATRQSPKCNRKTKIYGCISALRIKIAPVVTVLLKSVFRNYKLWSIQYGVLWGQTTCGGGAPTDFWLWGDLNHRTPPHRVCAYDGWGHGNTCLQPPASLGHENSSDPLRNLGRRGQSLNETVCWTNTVWFECTITRFHIQIALYRSRASASSVFVVLFCYIYIAIFCYILFFPIWWNWPLTWLTNHCPSVLGHTVGWVIWPIKLSPKWPIMCRVGC